MIAQDKSELAQNITERGYYVKKSQINYQ